MLWREAYEPLYRELLPSKQQLSVRTFLSTLVAKTLLQSTWAHAAEALGMDYVDALRRANGYTRHTVRLGHGHAMRSATHVLLRLLDERPQLVNYAERRARFATLANIDDEAWKAIANAAGIHLGHGTRQRNAAVWVWSELTDGPYYRAPAVADARQQPSGFVPRRSENDAYFWVVFNRFYREELPKLRPHLSAYAAQLLDGEPLRPFTEGDVVRALSALRSVA